MADVDWFSDGKWTYCRGLFSSYAVEERNTYCTRHGCKLVENKFEYPYEYDGKTGAARMRVAESWECPREKCDERFYRYLYEYPKDNPAPNCPEST